MNDWDRETIKPLSPYLKLSSKGDKVQIRIVGRVYREVQVWPRERGGKPIPREQTTLFTPGQWKRVYTAADWNPGETFHLLVIDRADGNAKILAIFPSTYNKIKEYAQNQAWGNPTGYDIVVERTEEPGKNYFSVMPLPNKSPVLQSELAKVDELDVSKLLQNAYPSSGPQPDDFDNSIDIEPLPWEQEPQRAAPMPESNVAAPLADPFNNDTYQDKAPAPGEEDVVIEDIDDKPVNLDDIPF